MSLNNPTPDPAFIGSRLRALRFERGLSVEYLFGVTSDDHRIHELGVEHASEN
jgi:hypothetical protein